MAMRPTLILKSLLAFALVLLAGTSASVVAAEFTHVKAVYSLKRDGQAIGRVVEIFERSGKRYRIVSEAEAQGVAALFVKGPLRMVSEGEIDSNGLKPHKFERLRNNKTVRATFDWPAAQLSIADNGSNSSVPLAAGTQDRLSAMYQFMFMPPKRSRIDMPMTNGKTPAAYTFNSAGREKISSVAGSFDTLRMKRERSGDTAGDDDSVELWLATRRKFLPVRVKIREDGALYEQDLVTLETR